MNIFEMIKDNVTARQVAEHYGLIVGRNGMACCPFHKDKTPSMKIDKRYFCFGCGEKGDAVDYVSKLYGMAKMDAARRIAADFGLNSDASRKPPPGIRKQGKTTEQIFRESQRYCFNVLCDYLRLLEKWEAERSPKNMNEKWDTLFCEALDKKEYICYLLDTLLWGSVEERALVITKFGRKVKDIEERVRYFGSGSDLCS